MEADPKFVQGTYLEYFPIHCNLDNDRTHPRFL